jgi:hypothetical protein
MNRSIGRYEIKSELGRGGMATVYLGWDPRFRREVAVKVLPREFLHDPQFRARFEREAQTIAMLDHPAIVPVHDFGDEDGLPYLVMRLMTGGSLAARLKQGPLSIAEASRILKRLAPALDEAHSRGVIHRDLKPGNILFDQRDDPYLSDFGIVKLTEATASFTGSALIGTPAYMSPEQVRGEARIDGRSDIYALGVILFEMLTGKQPYEATTPIGVAFKHVTDPVPRVLDFNPSLSLDTQAVIERAMSKAPEDRFQTAGAMAAALAAVASREAALPRTVEAEVIPPATTEHIRETVAAEPEPETREAAPAPPAISEVVAAPPEPILAPVVAPQAPDQIGGEAAPPTEPPTAPAATLPTVAALPAKRARRGLWVAAGIAGLVIAVGGGALIFSNNAAAPARQTSTATTSATSATAQALAEIEQPTATPTPRSPTATVPSPTPTVTLTPTPGPTDTPRPTATLKPIAAFAEPILAAIANRTPDFQDDFSTRAGGWTKGDWCADWRLKYVDGEMVVSDCHVEREMWYTDFVVEMDARFLPGSPSDSEWRFHYRRDRPGGGAPYFIDIEYRGDVEIGIQGIDSTWEYTRLQDAARPGANVNNHVLVIVKDRAVALFVNDLPVYYGALPIVWKNGGMEWSFGDTVAFDNFKVWDISDLPLTATVTPIPSTPTPTPRTATATVPSTSAQRIVRVYQDNSTGNYEIYAEYADGSKANLTNNPAHDMWPHLSPDGKQIAFTSNREGNWEVYAMNSDGSGVTNLTNNRASDQTEQEAWSPNGARIVFISARDGNPEIYVMNADGSGQTRLTNSPNWDNEVAWSPDGGRIAFVSRRDGNEEIYVMNADGSAQTRLTNYSGRDGEPTWLPDGRIKFSSQRSGSWEEWVMDADGSNVEKYPR